MNEDKIIIQKKNLKGDDGYKVFSIRIKKETADRLDEICVKSNHSRNELISLFLDYAIERCEIKE